MQHTLTAEQWCSRFVSALVRYGFKQSPEALDALALKRWKTAGSQSPEAVAFADYRAWAFAR